MAKFKVGDLVKTWAGLGVIVRKGVVSNWRVVGFGFGATMFPPMERFRFHPDNVWNAVNSNEIRHATRAEAIAFAKKYPRAKVNIPKAPRRPLPTKAVKRKAVKK